MSLYFTLRIQQSPCIAKHKVILTTATEQTGSLACSSSTGQRQQERFEVIAAKKQCSEWPAPALTDTERRRRHWCTAAAIAAWSSLVHLVLSLYAVLQVVETSHVSFNCTPSLTVEPTHCSQLDLNLENLETRRKWILNSLSTCENGTFQWRHNYVIITYCRALSLRYNWHGVVFINEFAC